MRRTEGSAARGPDEIGRRGLARADRSTRRLEAKASLALPPGWRVALTLALTFALGGAPAAAAPARGAQLTPSLADVSAAEAALVVRADVDALAALTDVAIARGNLLERTALTMVRAQLAEATGDDPTTRRGWTALGLDPDRPLVIAVRPLNHGDPSPPWRVSLRVPIADRKRLQRTLARFETWVHASAVTFTRGVPPEFAGRRVTSFRLPRAIGFVRLDARALAIDVVPMQGADQSPASLARFITDRSSPAAIDALLASDAGAALAVPGVDVWIDPQAVARTSLLTRGWSPRDAGPCNLTCVVLRGPLGPLGVSFGTRGATITVAARWQVEAGSPLATVLASTVDHGLPRPADVPDAALIMRSYVASWAPLAALDTRAVPLDLPPPVFASSPEAWPMTALWSWPVLIGGVIAHVTAAEPAAAPLLAGVGDFALAVLTLGDDLDHTAAIAEVAIDPATTATLHGFADQIWGAADAKIWGTGRIRGFARTLGATPTVGVAIRDAAPRWLPVGRASPPPPAGTVAEGRIAVEVLALLDPMAKYLGDLSFTATFDGALRIDLAFDPP